MGRDRGSGCSSNGSTSVSIHAPAWGATLGRGPGSHLLRGFNPRARMGRDDCRRRPAKTQASFNPRARMGRDWAGNQSLLRLAGFNPRARMGRDCCRPAPSTPRRGFNPRARMGRDKAFVNTFLGEVWFQSTRPHGARLQIQQALEVVVAVSIHAPAWGATGTWRRGWEWLEVSIHAPAWGATRRRNPGGQRQRVSIHAPAWGATSRLQ